MDDYGFQEPWLVCDFRLKRDVDLPMALQYGDPDQPTSIISIGPHHHRFSFMLDEVVSSAEAVDPDEVWRRVSRWITRDDAELIRAAPYTFRSTVAQQWKQGRILLAGDAAHQMPPFLGQGTCSGFRDAHNLAWKLDLVLQGAIEDLLETYAAERSPHVRAITEKAVELGRVQTVRDKQAARLRDEELLRRKRSGRRPEGFRFPGYSEGFLAPASPDDSARGQLFPRHGSGAARAVPSGSTTCPAPAGYSSSGTLPRSPVATTTSWPGARRAARWSCSARPRRSGPRPGRRSTMSTAPTSGGSTATGVLRSSSGLSIHTHSRSFGMPGLSLPSPSRGRCCAPARTTTPTPRRWARRAPIPAPRRSSS